ncbi:DNA/RNA non-specific endonuclease [Bacillus cereus]|uniref:DNA/RNA non-specific endonuclease n=1 Tax=Bacillus sp. OE TaxID=2293320 RepID=UPI00159B8D24
MVQSLKENKTLKNALDAVKNTPIPVAVRMVDTGIGVKIPYVESSTVGEVAGKFSKASTAAKDDAYQLAKGTGKGGSTVSEVKTFVDKGKHFTNGRKNRLKPNIRYKTGEYDYFYETDSLGRIERFETEKLQLTEREKRLSHSKNTLGKVKGQDHAGHLAGDRFGGSPKIDNLVSQLSDVNMKEYKKIENEWAAALNAKPPKEVTVDVEIVYAGNDMRPEKFIVNYLIDGKPGFKVIKINLRSEN